MLVLGTMAPYDSSVNKVMGIIKLTKDIRNSIKQALVENQFC